MASNLEQQLADRGLLIEAGWQSLKEVTLKGAPPIQVREMRKAFFAGAAHLLHSCLRAMDDSEDASPDDVRRLEMVSVELAAFEDSLKREAREIYDPI